MKIHLISDLHLEFEAFNYNPPECDVVVLAGDIANGIDGIEWASYTFSCPVIYIPGNREFHKHSIYVLIDQLRLATVDTKVNVLYNDSIIIDGVKFIGATLWTDLNYFRGQDEILRNPPPKRLKDYRNILWDRETNWTVNHVLNEHKKSLQFIKRELQENLNGVNIVISHHAPCGLSIETKFRNCSNTFNYVSRLENDIRELQPTKWLHGHLHGGSNYYIGNTHVVSNPRGYKMNGEFENRNFLPDLLLEI